MIALFLAGMAMAATPSGGATGGATTGAASAGAATGTATYYHADDVASESKVFSALSADLAPRFEDLQTQVARLGTATGELERGMALLGDTATAEMQAWALETRKQVTGRYLQAQRHMDLLQDDYANVFGEALERALQVVPGGTTAKVCGGGSGIARLRGPECEGEPLNKALAAQIDADKTLGRELADIQGVPWPSLAVEPVAQPVVALTGTKRWVSIAAVAKAFIPGALDARLTTLQDALVPFAADLDARKPEAVAKAAALKKAYIAGIGQDGLALREAVLLGLERWKEAPAEVGFCGNPKVLGGCVGEDVTGAVIKQLEADKKVVKAMGKIGG